MTRTTILVIDDDAGIRRSLALSLKQAGYAVFEAASGRSGLEVALAQSPALVICDVNMPEMDGYDVVAALRQSNKTASIPFIFLTARGERAEMRRGMNLGADDYLTKPFTRDELLEAVKVRLRKHDAEREALAQQLILDTGRRAGNAEGAALAPKAALREVLLALLGSGPSRSAPLRIKNYAVIAKLGVPNGSALYLAERDSDGKSVAVRLRQLAPGGEAAFHRFIERAKMIGLINHPNVAPIFDHGFADDIAYIVTEYFPRGSLKQSFSLPLPAPQALAVLRQAAAGLAEVHRLCAGAEDVRPENLLVRHNGEIALAELDSPTDADAIHYRAPERMLGDAGDQRSDIYALGVILYEMLTAQRPYGAASAEELRHRIINAPVPSLPLQLASYQDLLNQMLAKQPAQRYRNAEALLDHVRMLEASS